MPSSVIVAIETSSRIGSVALGNEQELWEEQFFTGPMRHTSECLPTLKTLLAEHHCDPTDITELRLSIGPGSFTGLRIAVSLAKSMALAQTMRIVTVDTLDTIAANLTTDAIPTAQTCIALLDAKRNQFFTAGYRRDSASGPWRKDLNDSILTTDEIMEGFVAQHDCVYVLGDALVYHQEKFTHKNTIITDDSLWSPRASQVFALGQAKSNQGQFADPMTLEPFYLRGPQVTLKRR